MLAPLAERPEADVDADDAYRAAYHACRIAREHPENREYLAAAYTALDILEAKRKVVRDAIGAMIKLASALERPVYQTHA